MKTNKTVSYIDRHGKVNRSTVEKIKRESSVLDYTQYLNIGFYLAAPLLFGVFAGIKLDQLFHTKPILTITLIVLGAIATFYNLIRITKENA